MTKSPSSGRDEKLEAWIASYGASQTLKTIAVITINQTKSRQNQSRFTPLVDETVGVYAAAMERGDKFPPIVVYKEEKGGYVVIDGNHRVAAADMSGITEIEAYVLDDVNERQIQTMTFEANTKHGLPSSLEERLAHGVYLVDLGVTQVKAAQLVNVPPSQFDNALRKEQIGRRLARLGIERWQTVPVHSRLRLGALRDDVILRAAFELVVAAHLNAEETSNLVTAINKETTTTAQLAVIEDRRNVSALRIRTSAGGRVPMPSDMIRLLRAISYSEGLKPESLPEATKALNDEQRHILADRLNTSIVMLMEAKRLLSE